MKNAALVFAMIIPDCMMQSCRIYVYHMAVLNEDTVLGAEIRPTQSKTCQLVGIGVGVFCLGKVK